MDVLATIAATASLDRNANATRTHPEGTGPATTARCVALDGTESTVRWNALAEPAKHAAAMVFAVMVRPATVHVPASRTPSMGRGLVVAVTTAHHRIGDPVVLPDVLRTQPPAVDTGTATTGYPVVVRVSATVPSPSIPMVSARSAHWDTMVPTAQGAVCP